MAKPALRQLAASWRTSHFSNSAAVAPRALPFPSSMPVQLNGHMSAKSTISKWPDYSATPLLPAPRLADICNIKELWLKDESERLGVGSFKVLGGALAAMELLGGAPHAASKPPLAIATASAGNHGIAVAWACKVLAGGTTACHVFLNYSVADKHVERIRSYGATVHRVEGTYEDALAEAKRQATANDWAMVQDVSWEGYHDTPRRIFEGYTVLASEMIDQFADACALPPTHVFVNSGVGGLATAICSHFWARYGADRPRFVIVEPAVSACLLHAARSGLVAQLEPCEERTIQVGLDTKIADELAWHALAVGADDFVAVGDEVVEPCLKLLRNEVSPPIIAGDSAVAGLGALIAAAAQPELQAALGIDSESRVAIIVCEGSGK